MCCLAHHYYHHLMMHFRPQHVGNDKQLKFDGVLVIKFECKLVKIEVKPLIMHLLFIEYQHIYNVFGLQQTSVP